MIPSTEPIILALLESGFVGTANQIQSATGVNHMTVRNHLRSLERRGVVKKAGRVSVGFTKSHVWSLKTKRIEPADLLAAEAYVAAVNVPIVVRALLARPALHLWATGELATS